MTNAPEGSGSENNNQNTPSSDQSAYMPKAEENPIPATPEASTSITPPSEPAAVPPPTGTGFGFERQNSDLLWVAKKVSEVRGELAKYVIGQTEMVDLMMTGIFANGHLLLEGAPGVAKTLSAKVLSRSLNVGFSRIQFTPDMMPSDVIGTSVFHIDRKSTRLNSSHRCISYAVFCLKKKKKQKKNKKNKKTKKTKKQKKKNAQAVTEKD